MTETVFTYNQTGKERFHGNASKIGTLSRELDIRVATVRLYVVARLQNRFVRPARKARARIRAGGREDVLRRTEPGLGACVKSIWLEPSPDGAIFKQPSRLRVLKGTQ